MNRSPKDRGFRIAGPPEREIPNHSRPDLFPLRKTRKARKIESTAGPPDTGQVFGHKKAQKAQKPQSLQGMCFWNHRCTQIHADGEGDGRGFASGADAPIEAAIRPQSCYSRLQRSRAASPSQKVLDDPSQGRLRSFRSVSLPSTASHGFATHWSLIATSCVPCAGASGPTWSPVRAVPDPPAVAWITKPELILLMGHRRRIAQQRASNG